MLYETVKEQDNFVSITHARVLMDTLVAIGYIIAYGKSYILVEAMPKLVLYGKYDTQRVVLRQNIVLGFALWLYLFLTQSFIFSI